MNKRVLNQPSHDIIGTAFLILVFSISKRQPLNTRALPLFEFDITFRLYIIAVTSIKGRFDEDNLSGVTELAKNQE